MKYRHRVLLLLAALSILTYLDRVCISVAGPRIQNELNLSPQDWGLVTGAFAIAYALFEIPSGYLGDVFGARSMLTRIVIWWSAFTTLTGFASKLSTLLVIRFCFGVGEAGAYPTASTSVFRWFPANERGRVFGIVWLSSQLGGAIAPLLIVPLQMSYGWRASFYVFGIVGIAWAAGWWRWYRNHPGESAGISNEELAEIGPPAEVTSHAFPWRAIAANRSVWAIMGSAGAYLYSYYFFLFWLPTFLVRARGFTEGQTMLSTVPFLVGAIANLAGGYARDAAVLKWGPTWGPRCVCLIGLVIAACAALGVVLNTGKISVMVSLGLCYGGMTFQQPTVWATCVDIGKRHAGAVSGCLNTAAATGGLLSSLIFGYLVEHYGNYDAVLVSMAAALFVGAGLWLRIDATETLRAPNPSPGTPA